MPRVFGRGLLPRLWVSACVAWALPAALGAQVTAADSLRDDYRLPVPTVEQSAGVLVVPAGDLAAGLGRGAGSGYLNLYAGAAYTRFTRYVRGDHDGVGMVGMGFGDPYRWIGVQGDLMLYSTIRSGFFKRMGLSFEVYRYLPGDFLLTVGWENAITRGTPDSGESRYATVSVWLPLGDGEGWFPAFALSGGAGDGRFVSEEDWLEGNTDHFNPIGTVALQVARPLMLLASWQGDDGYVGASIMPFGGSLVITPGIADVTGKVSTGPRFVITGGLMLRLRLPWAGEQG